MKKLFLVLCLTLIALTSVNSQNTSTITITSDQLRTTNLIFAEHYKFSQQIPLMKKQISDLKLINDSWVKTDSLNRLEILRYKTDVTEKDEAIKDFKQTLKRKNKVILGTTASSCILLVICLLLK